MYDDGCDEICVGLQAMHKRLYLVNMVHKEQEERTKPAKQFYLLYPQTKAVKMTVSVHRHIPPLMRA